MTAAVYIFFAFSLIYLTVIGAWVAVLWCAIALVMWMAYRRADQHFKQALVELNELKRTIAVGTGQYRY